MGRREEIEDAVYRRLRAELGMGGAPISDGENLPPEVKALLDRPVDHPWVH